MPSPQNTLRVFDVLFELLRQLNNAAERTRGAQMGDEFDRNQLAV
jgi:hypothetical protein